MLKINTNDHELSLIIWAITWELYVKNEHGLNGLNGYFYKHELPRIDHELN